MVGCPWHRSPRPRSNSERPVPPRNARVSSSRSRFHAPNNQADSLSNIDSQKPFPDLGVGAGTRYGENSTRVGFYFAKPKRGGLMRPSLSRRPLALLLVGLTGAV